MVVARHWLFRASIAGNAFVIFYFAIYSSTKYNPPSTTVPLVNYKTQVSNYNQSGYFTLEQMSVPEIPPPGPLNAAGSPPSNPLEPGPPEESVPLEQSNKNGVPNKDLDNSLGPMFTLLDSQSNRELAHADFDSGDGGPEDNSLQQNEISKDDETDTEIDPVKLFPCDDYTPHTHFGQRGPFWVLYNYVKPRKNFGCDESMTYTTHADFTFLDNLIPLLERWNGPISLAVYTPGTDFNNTLKRISYLRECTAESALIKDYVSFHLFFDYKHTPKTKVPRDLDQVPVNCSGFKDTDLIFGEHLSTYRKEKKLPYPVNVARNIAREMSTTYYILPSDIELYPNPNLIPDFLDMIGRNDTPELQRPNPNKLFVLSIFEVEANVTRLPEDKSELVYMLRNQSAIPFHKYVCANCHRIPKAKDWIDFPVFPGLNVFHVGKRYKPYHHWEPIFIGTIKDPFYDERLTWEGRSDKMTQGYVLCVLDYEFHILDNAFLVHRPGIKKSVTIPSKTPVVSKQNSVIAKIILPELKQLYGTKTGCYV